MSLFSPPSKLPEIVLRLLLAALALGLPWLLASLQPEAARTTASEIAVRLAPGGEAILGRAELAAAQSEAAHLRVRRDPQGRWWLANVSQARAVEVRRQGEDESLGSLPLVAGLRFWLAGRPFRVEAAGPRLAVRDDSGHGWWFDGADSGPMDEAGAGDAYGACGGEGGRAAARRAIRHGWNVLAPEFLQRRQPLVWGGHVACDGRAPLPALAPGEIWVAREAGGYVLHATTAASRRICLADARGECGAGGYLDERELPLDEVTRLVAGRTAYEPVASGDTLTLRLLGRGEWLAPEAVAGRAAALHAKGVSWRLRGEDLWRLPVTTRLAGEPAWALAAGAAALLMAAGLAVLARRWAGVAAADDADRAALGVVVVAATALLALAAFMLPQAVGAGWYSWLAAVAMVLLATAPWRDTWTGGVLAGAAVLMAAGVATLWVLGWQAGDTGGLRYFQKAAAAAALATSLWSLVGHAARLRGLRRLRSARREVRPGWLSTVGGQETAIFALCLMAIALLALQAAVGAEEGVFGLQPIELGLLALVLSAAHVLALRQECGAALGLRGRLLLWLKSLLPLALFVGMVAMSLLFLDDYSPLVLIAAWLAGLVVAWTAAARSVAGALIVVAAALAAAWAYRWIQGDGLAWLTAYGFYPDRFAVWVDPLHHPHSGEQYLRAAQLLAQGGWAGNPAVSGWRIPAVQADFTPAFFGARFGARAVVALLLIQAAWVAALLTLGWRHLLRARHGDYARAWRGRLMFFALWGFGGLFAGHFALSWATNFGLLPVMGQPMPLLAAGSSLLLLLVTPFLALLNHPQAMDS